MWWTLCLSALRQTRRYALQSAIAVLGVTIGVANIIVLISITDLGRRQATGLMRDFGANMIFVTPYFDTQKGPLGSFNHAIASDHIPGASVAAVAAAPEIEAVSGILFIPAHVAHKAATYFTTVQGSSPGFSEMRGQHVITGRWLTAEDDSTHAKVACLGQTVIAELFPKTNPLGEEIEIKGLKLRVIGTMERKGRVGFEDTDSRVFIPLTTAQDISGFQEIHGLVANYRTGVSEKQALATVWRQLATLARSGEQAEDSFSVMTVRDARQVMDKTMSIFSTVLAGISSIAMLVAGIGIMNVMLIRVLQRRKEIGVRRAVGATPRAIMLQFLFEGLFQALSGALLGTLLGGLGVIAYCRWADWQPYVSPLTVVLAVAFSGATGLMFAAYPAARAARLDPIAVLRME